MRRTIRLTETTDITALQNVLDATELFPTEMLPQMFNSTCKQASALWLTAFEDDKPVGFCHAIAEEMTNRTWNLLAIAVDPASQGGGHGRSLVSTLEMVLREKEQRLLIIDTSGTDAFSRTRNFYRDLGYGEAARIRDFWDAGDDKVTFRKQL